MEKRIILGCIISGIIFVCGCGKEKLESGLIVGSGNKKLTAMQPEDVIVIINGKTLTREKLERMLKNNERDFKKERPNAMPALVEDYVKRRRRALVGEFINRQLYITEAEKRKIVVSDEMLAKYQNVYLERARQKDQSLSEFAEMMGDTPEDFKKRIYERALIKNLTDIEFGDKLEVTEKDLQNEKKKYVRYNAKCDATNKLVNARGLMIVEKLRAGVDFEAMAIEYSESGEDENGLWGEFSRAEVDDAKLRNAAFTLPVGSVSDPIETDEGLFIIKIMSRTGGDAIGFKDEFSVKLGRIFLRLGKNLECPDEPEMRKAIALAKGKYYQVPFLKKIRAESRLEFPNGTNLWDLAKNDRLPKK